LPVDAHAPETLLNAQFSRFPKKHGRRGMTGAAQAVGLKDMANAIRALAMDAVEKAKSGHPGMPMGMADVATVLFKDFLSFDPAWPEWPNRDRFVLSAGHGSMLLYALLYLTGYADVTIEEIRNFRQWGSKTPGHPEYGVTKGVETTTGPLGQGLATAVGMAMAERLAAAQFGDDLVSHYTYAIVGDGCLMEGISQEAITLAGHLKLNKLIVLWDDNRISIDGPTSLSTSEDQRKRFEAAGWETMAVDGHDAKAVHEAIAKAHGAGKPVMIACRTVIGFGAPRKQGTAATHGSPLGAEEIAAARQALGWPHEPFVVPEDVLGLWRAVGEAGRKRSAEWRRLLDAHPRREEFERRLSGVLPLGFKEAVSSFKKKMAEEKPKIATRQGSQAALEVLNHVLPETVGGSADLTGSNNTKTKELTPVTPDDFSGRYIHYGIREHGMAAAMNGLALYGLFLPYGGTFLTFTDYCRPAIRLSALMKLRVVYVMTHDSIGLGEDGPTHQPVEHLAALRAMPNLHVFRPADPIETMECWQLAIESPHTPSIIALTRQALAPLREGDAEENHSALGAYEIRSAQGEARVTLMATGSEVEIAVAAQGLLAKEGIGARVVSVPSMELFNAQPAPYRESVLGNGLRIAIEAGVGQPWQQYLRDGDRFIGMTGFGESAPYQELYDHFGITAEHIVKAAKDGLS
jgi:transketolase